MCDPMEETQGIWRPTKPQLQNSMVDGTQGVWCTYMMDTQPVVHRVDAVLERIVLTMDSGDQIFWWPYGMEINDAIKAWRDRQSNESRY